MANKEVPTCCKELMELKSVTSNSILGSTIWDSYHFQCKKCRTVISQ